MTSLKELLASGEESERRARSLRDQKPAFESCNQEYDSEFCEDCERHESCESKVLTARDEIESLFEQAWQGYRETEKLAREYTRATDSIEGSVLLAQVLMDIHIHPNSGYELDTEALWEAQYLWLHLYYRTGKQEYFKQAKLCDGIRHATVRKIQ